LFISNIRGLNKITFLYIYKKNGNSFKKNVLKNIQSIYSGKIAMSIYFSKKHHILARNPLNHFKKNTSSGHNSSCGEISEQNQPKQLLRFLSNFQNTAKTHLRQDFLNFVAFEKFIEREIKFQEKRTPCNKAAEKENLNEEKLSENPAKKEPQQTTEIKNSAKKEQSKKETLSEEENRENTELKSSANKKTVQEEPKKPLNKEIQENYQPENTQKKSDEKSIQNNANLPNESKEEESKNNTNKKQSEDSPQNQNGKNFLNLAMAEKQAAELLNYERFLKESKKKELEEKKNKKERYREKEGEEKKRIKRWRLVGLNDSSQDEAE